MKPYIKEFFNEIECKEDQGGPCIRNKVEDVDASDASNIQDAIKRLIHLINHAALEKQECLGCYYLFLGFVYQENSDIEESILILQKSLPELSRLHKSKAAAHCLLSMSYEHKKQYVKAQSELQEAQKLLKPSTRTASYLEYKKSHPPSSMEERIKKRMNNLNDKIFLDETPPDPTPRK